MVLVGLAQLICPVAGLVSDQYRSKYGRRRPLLFHSGGDTIFSTRFECGFSRLLRSFRVWFLTSSPLVPSVVSHVFSTRFECVYSCVCSCVFGHVSGFHCFKCCDFLISLFLTMCALNVAFSVQGGLVADVVHPEQKVFVKWKRDICLIFSFKRGETETQFSKCSFLQTSGVATVEFNGIC
jgi:hypothetical protein